MSRRWKIVLAVAAAAIVAGLVMWLVWPPEPTYQGKPISAWLDDFAVRKGDYYTAVREIGTNGLPYAVRSLARNDSKWHKKYAELQPKLPRFLRTILPDPKRNLQVVDGANVFSYVGSNSIPDAITLLKHRSPTVRQAAAWGLGVLRRQTAAANQAIPALIDALRDNERMVRWHAAFALKEMGADASNAVPALTKVLADTGTGPQTNDFFYLRAVVAVALGKIGPKASSALPALRAAMQESNPYFRGTAAVAIWRISSDVDTTVPVLLRDMPGIVEDSKWDMIIALGEMGPRARAAIPQLQSELAKSRQRWVLDHVTNALLKIDPAFFGEGGTKVKEKGSE